MKFDFFTFGGSVFWEDVFFYQKWRIQRHCFTKKYRLLDSWDIRRASGAFEYCQNAFIRYIESYEIPRQQGKMVVLLHGYAEGKNIFKPLWRKLVLTNSVVAAINYPSLFRSATASAYQLLFFLNHAEDISEISFVTKGAGNLVLQRLFDLPSDLQTYQAKMRIGNIVTINPVTKENLLCEILNKFRLFRIIFGPMLYDFTSVALKSAPKFSQKMNVLQIFAPSKFDIFFSKLLKIFHLYIDSPASKDKNSLHIKKSTFNTLKNNEVLNYTVKFINNGKI